MSLCGAWVVWDDIPVAWFPAPETRLCHCLIHGVTVSQSKGSDVFNGCGLGDSEVGTILDLGSYSSTLIIIPVLIIIPDYEIKAGWMNNKLWSPHCMGFMNPMFCNLLIFCPFVNILIIYTVILCMQHGLLHVPSSLRHTNFMQQQVDMAGIQTPIHEAAFWRDLVLI